MAMGETSSDCGVLGVLASKLRVWRSVGILLVLFRVYSENIPFFYRFPGTSGHIRAAPPTPMPKLHTLVIMPSKGSKEVLSKFVDPPSPQESLSVWSFFETNLRHLIKEACGPLNNATVVLSQEGNPIEVSDLSDELPDYIGMGLKQFIFYVDEAATWLESTAARKHREDNAGVLNGVDDYVFDTTLGLLSSERTLAHAQGPPTQSFPRRGTFESVTTRDEYKREVVATTPVKIQATLAHFFGNGVTKKTQKVVLSDGTVRQEGAGAQVLVLDKTVSSENVVKRSFLCEKGCGRSFDHGPARAHHQKVCKGPPEKELECVEADDEEAGGEADNEAEDQGQEDANRQPMREAIPYPFDPAPCEGSNTAAHDAVAKELGIDSSTPVEMYDELLRAHPRVLHRLAVTEGLYARYKAVAERARALAAEIPLPGAELEAPTLGAAAGPIDEQPRKRKRKRHDGGFKQSGLREGDKRKPRTIYFKYEVVQYYRKMQKFKDQGLCPTPGDSTVERFGGGMTKGQVSTWANQEATLRAALMHANCITGRGKKTRTCSEKLMPFKSRAARRCTLHKGKNRPFAAAEAEVHALYREKRKKGLPVTAHYLRVQMKTTVRKHYGMVACDTFKASGRWLQKFARHFEMSLRRKTNKKHLSVEERLPKCKRWHARFRRRLQGGPKSKLDPKWGRWLPEDRISTDQVPCNLREGDGRTYADTGEKRVWLAGSKADCGKRFCTLQVSARCCNGDRNKPRSGQPKLTIVFRGQGQSPGRPRS